MTQSSRRLMIAGFKDLWKKARNGAYFTKRGPIDWSSYTFEKKARAVSILVDDTSMMTVDGITPASMSFEIGAPINEDRSNPEIDDGLLDELFEDAQLVLEGIQRLQQPGTQEPVILGMDRNVSVVEWHSAELKIQGIVVIFNLKF